MLKKAEQARKQKAAEPKTKKVAAAPAVVAAAQTAAKNDKQGMLAPGQKLFIIVSI